MNTADRPDTRNIITGSKTDSSLRTQTSPPNSLATGKQEREEGLFRELQQNLDNAQRLQQQSGIIKEELRKLIQGRIRPARRQLFANNSPKTVIVTFPVTEFTIEDLETANATVDPAVVRFHLGVALSRRRVEFILPDEYNESVSQIIRYRKARQSVRRRPDTNGFAHNGH